VRSLLSSGHLPGSRSELAEMTSAQTRRRVVGHAHAHADLQLGDGGEKVLLGALQRGRTVALQAAKPLPPAGVSQASDHGRQAGACPHLLQVLQIVRSGRIQPSPSFEKPRSGESGVRAMSTV
jgi:hypothetical protein